MLINRTRASKSGVSSMKTHGLESVESLLKDEGFLFKLIANDAGVVLFPYTTEHRDACAPGIRYADDSAGNALAAMVKPGRIEFRFHTAFSDERVRLLVSRILACDEMTFARSFTVTYQGRQLLG